MSPRKILAPEGYAILSTTEQCVEFNVWGIGCYLLYIFMVMNTCFQLLVYSLYVFWIQIWTFVCEAAVESL